MLLGINFSRPAWVKLNHLQTGVGLFCLETHKCDMAFIVTCECGTKEQKAENVIASCPIYHHPNGAHAFSDVDKSLVTWLKKTSPAI